MEQKIDVSSYFFTKVIEINNQKIQINPIRTIPVTKLPAACNLVIMLIINGLTDKLDTTVQITLRRKTTGEKFVQSEPFKLSHIDPNDTIVQFDLEEYEFDQVVSGEYEAVIAITQDLHTETYVGTNTLQIIKTDMTK